MTLADAPRLTKGAFVSIDPAKPTPRVIPFQYNPETLSRSLAPPAGGEGAGEGRAGPVYVAGAPVETFEVEIELHAAENMPDVLAGDANPVATRLAALELLVYPSVDDVGRVADLAAKGALELVGPFAPFTLFSYGASRVVPVRIGSCKITELLHDHDLNPLHAKVAISLRVLSYDDLPPSHPGYGVFLAYQSRKETLGRSALPPVAGRVPEGLSRAPAGSWGGG